MKGILFTSKDKIQRYPATQTKQSGDRWG